MENRNKNQLPEETNDMLHSPDLKTKAQDAESSRGGTTNLSLEQLKEEGGPAGKPNEPDDDNPEGND